MARAFAIIRDLLPDLRSSRLKPKWANTALEKLEDHLRGIDAKLVNVVQDEIVLEVAEEDVERAKEAAERAMVEGMLAIFLTASTRSLAEAKMGRNWAEAK